MEIEFKILSSEDIGDFIELIKLFGDVFEMGSLKIPDNKHLEDLLKKPDFFALIAKNNNKVVGGLTVYILQRYYSTRPVAYIYDVGVMPDHQRTGI
jgi:aminoglycoside 3-N-acetyltransferase I